MAAVAHADFQFSGKAGKAHRMREFLVFHDPPSYFNENGKYLTWKMDLPKDLLQNARPSTGTIDIKNTMGHFAIVNHQLL